MRVAICSPAHWSSAADQRSHIVLKDADLTATVFWQDVLLWHLRRRSNSCLWSPHERSREAMPLALLLKHYLTAYNVEVVVFPPPSGMECFFAYPFFASIITVVLIDSVLVDLCDSFSIHAVTSHNSSPSIAEVLSCTLARWPPALSQVPLQPLWMCTE